MTALSVSERRLPPCPAGGCCHRYGAWCVGIFLLLSCLVHGLAVMAPLPRHEPAFVEALSQAPLRVRIREAAPIETPAKAPEPPPPEATALETPPPASTTPDTPRRPSPAKDRLQPAQTKSPRGVTAAELIERAFTAAPDIARREAQRDAPTKAPDIFDQAFRKKLEAARRRQARREILRRELAKRPDIEFIADYGDYIGLRIGDKCMRYPVPKADEPFDDRIGMFEYNCPKQKLDLFPDWETREQLLR